MPNLTFLSKQFFLKLLLVLWMVFSMGYIGWSIWSNIRYTLISQAYQQGITDAVNQLIQTAENNDCKPIPVFNKEAKKEIQLINSKCLINPNNKL